MCTDNFSGGITLIAYEVVQDRIKYLITTSFNTRAYQRGKMREGERNRRVPR